MLILKPLLIGELVKQFSLVDILAELLEEDLACRDDLLGIMGDVYDKTFDYDIYLKIYQYLTKPAENIRFSGDKEDRVPYIYTLYKQFTAELSNFKSEGVKAYKKINIFGEEGEEDDEGGEDEETFDGEQKGEKRHHDDDNLKEDTREHKSRDPPQPTEEEVNRREERLKALKGGAKKQKPLHAMNIRELCNLASKFKNVKNPYFEKK